MLRHSFSQQCITHEIYYVTVVYEEQSAQGYHLPSTTSRVFITTGRRPWTDGRTDDRRVGRQLHNQQNRLASPTARLAASCNTDHQLYHRRSTALSVTINSVECGIMEHLAYLPAFPSIDTDDNTNMTDHQLDRTNEWFMNIVDTFFLFPDSPNIISYDFFSFTRQN